MDSIYLAGCKCANYFIVGLLITWLQSYMKTVFYETIFARLIISMHYRSFYCTIHSSYSISIDAKKN